MYDDKKEEDAEMKLAHVTIRTEKFMEEIEFYREIAGLGIARDLREIGEDIVFLADRAGDTRIEIINTLGAADAGNANLSLGFSVPDAKAKREALIQRGMEATPIVSPVPQVQFFFVKDPAGVSVQFVSDQS